MADNAKGSRDSVRNVLDFPKQTKVNEWVVKNYLEQGLDDVASAASASIDLGFPVSAGNIKYFRLLNNFDANYGRKRDKAEIAMELRIRALEENLDSLSTKVNAIILAAKLNIK